MRVIQVDAAPNEISMQVVYQCAFSGCKSVFIGYYGKLGDPKLVTLKSFTPKTAEIPAEISSLSEMFTSIYKVADEAMIHGLSQIAGPGYRKAFEFLIKDYAKSLSEVNTWNEIEKASAGTVINKYIADPRYKR